MTQELELTILMPCLNEAETLGTCIRKAHAWLEACHVSGEVIIADNGSTDGSRRIAELMNARVIPVPMKGYGSALLGGISAARGKYIIMGDADDSYDFSNLMPFLEKLRAGYELVMGNRFRGGIQRGAMPRLHRYLGNPVLTTIGRLFFHSPCRDFHCGLRGFRRDTILNLDLRATGMEFASEMVVKATIHRLRIAEVPTTLFPDGRSRAPHLRSWRDGWRHLRFLLLFSPKWLFLYPGAALIGGGLLIGAWLISGPIQVGRVGFDVQTMLYCAGAIVIGLQGILFAVFSKVFAIQEGFLPPDPRLARAFRWITLESGIVFGAFLILLGLVGSVYAVGLWGDADYGALSSTRSLRLVIPSITTLILGFQVILGSFFLSVLGLQRK